MLQRWNDSQWSSQTEYISFEMWILFLLHSFESLIHETTIHLSDADETVSVKDISKIQDSQGGTSSWSLYIWELIIEQLLTGTPPTSVNSNIVAIVKAFSPTTNIKELTRIWQALTVLLVVVQTLARNCIAKDKNWEQLFNESFLSHYLN